MATLAISLGSKAVSLIGGALFAASKKRAAEAHDENGAATLGVQHFDEGLSQIMQAANSGQISASEASQLLDQLMPQYWEIVGPHIQPGRNGCQTGAAIKPATGGPVGSPQGNAYYGCLHVKNWGAGCCIGNTLNASLENVRYALRNPGKPVSIFKLFPSKYGFPGREGYNVQYNAPPKLSAPILSGNPVQAIAGGVSHLDHAIQGIERTLGIDNGPVAPGGAPVRSRSMLGWIVAAGFVLVAFVLWRTR